MNEWCNLVSMHNISLNRKTIISFPKMTKFPEWQQTNLKHLKFFSNLKYQSIGKNQMLSKFPIFRIFLTVKISLMVTNEVGTLVSKKSLKFRPWKTNGLGHVSQTFVELIFAAFTSGFSATLMSSRSSKKLSGHVFTKG